MIKIGITGGIGVGKSTITKEFESLGIKTYIMDARVRYLIHNITELRFKLINLFGNNVFLSDGAYNNKLVANVVFNNDVQLHKLTHIIEEYLIVDYNYFFELNKDLPYVIVESAYFYENHIDNIVDFMIGVHASFPVRMERVQKRDNISYDDVMCKIHKQMNQTDKLFLCDFLIDNNESYDKNEIIKLDKLFKKINSLCFI